MKKLSRVFAGITAAALLGTGIAGTALAASQPEYEGTLVQQYYDNTWQNCEAINVESGGKQFVSYVRQNTGYSFVDALGDSNGRSLRVKFLRAEGVPEKFVANLADSAGKYVLDLSGVNKATTALQFYIGIPSTSGVWMTDRMKIEAGLTCATEATASGKLHAGLRADISSYIDYTPQDGNWQHVTLPLSELTLFDANGTEMAEFDWTKVSGVSFALNSDALRENNGNALCLDDIKLVENIQAVNPGEETKPAVTKVAFYDGSTPIDSLAGVSSVSAKVTLDYPESMQGQKAVILIAGYDSEGIGHQLSNVSVKEIDLTQTEFSTAQLPVLELDAMVSVYVWNNLEDIVPWEAGASLINFIKK